jgi:hypothetical protein
MESEAKNDLLNDLFLSYYEATGKVFSPQLQENLKNEHYHGYNPGHLAIKGSIMLLRGFTLGCVFLQAYDAYFPDAMQHTDLPVNAARFFGLCSMLARIIILSRPAWSLSEKLVHGIVDAVGRLISLFSRQPETNQLDFFPIGMGEQIRIGGWTVFASFSIYSALGMIQKYMPCEQSLWIYFLIATGSSFPINYSNMLRFDTRIVEQWTRSRRSGNLDSSSSLKGEELNDVSRDEENAYLLSPLRPSEKEKAEKGSLVCDKISYVVSMETADFYQQHCGSERQQSEQVEVAALVESQSWCSFFSCLSIQRSAPTLSRTESFGCFNF